MRGGSWIPRESGGRRRQVTVQLRNTFIAHARGGDDATKGVAELGGDADFEEVFIDSTIVRAHQHAAGAKHGDQGIGRGRGGWTAKTHALVDELGIPARFRLTGGRAEDSPEALPLLDEPKPARLAADKAYDSNAILQHLQSAGILAVIPSLANRLEQRTLGEHLYASRNIINASSAASSNSSALPRATTSSPNASHRSSRSPPHSFGSAGCQQALVPEANVATTEYNGVATKLVLPSEGGL